jgi:hypothetical protein
MKYSTFILLILMSLFILSCTKIFGHDKEDFINAYKELLIAKEQIGDSIQLVDSFKKIYEKYNYTEKSFNSDLLKYQKNTNEFLEILDSIKSQISKEEVEIQKSTYHGEE